MKLMVYLLLVSMVMAIIPVNAYGIAGTYKAMDNTNVSFEVFTGKLLFVEAFATWCENCANQWVILHDNNIFQKFNGSIQFFSLAVSSTDNLTTVADYNVTHPTPWRLGWDNTHNFSNTYQISSFPNLLFFDSNGNLANCIVGTQSNESLSKNLSAFIANPAQYAKDTGNSCSSGTGFGTIFSSPYVYVIVIFYGAWIGIAYLRKKNTPPKQ